MARSKQTSLKTEKEKKKKKKREEKEEKREMRKANSNKGKGFENMIAYVDHNGQISDTPPDPDKKNEMKLEDIQLGAKPRDLVEEQAEEIRKGRITYLSQSKGYGFIKDGRTKESLFFHISTIKTAVREGDMVTYDVVKGHKGPTAVGVTKVD